jgi:hypothetical protein
MSRLTQVKHGLKQISQGTQRVLGLTKIMSLLSPYFKSLSKNTSVGYAQIAEGVKHIFGQTKDQLRDKWLHRLMVDMDEKKRKDWFSVYQNWYRYYHDEAAGRLLHERSSRCPFTAKEFVALAHGIMQGLGTSKLIGVQPFIASHGLVYRMGFVMPEVEPVEQVENPSALDHVPANPHSFEFQGRFEITSNTIETRYRKLAARVHYDASQVTESDQKQLILAFLASDIAMDIDQEHLSNIEDLAIPTEDLPDHYLAVGICKASNQIAQRARRGAGNWAIVSAKAKAVLQESRAVKWFDQPTESGILTHIGTLNDTIALYERNDLNPGEPYGSDVLVGYKGSSDVDAGYIFAPQIPAAMSGVLIDPNTFQPVWSMMTRYGTYKSKDAENYFTKFNLI